MTIAAALVLALLELAQSAAALDAGPPDAEVRPESAPRASTDGSPPARFAVDGSPVRHGTTARQDNAAALARVHQGRFEEALPLFASALAKDPGNAAYLTDYGFTLARLGRRSEAEQSLRAAIERDPRRWYAYANLADLLADDPGRWERRDAAVALMERGLAAVEDSRGRANVAIRLANFERSVGRTAAARARLTPLLQGALSPAQRMRALEQLDAIDKDERALALADWPERPLSALHQEQLGQAARRLEALDPAGALELTRGLVTERADSTSVRWLRARALEVLERYDDAVGELTVIVQVAPSNARAWRKLGILLASHGGSLEAERADEALRYALALEPSWTDLRDLREQLKSRLHRVREGASAAHHAPEPSSRARALHREAEEWLKVGDPADLAADLLQRALDDSPAFVAAALSAYALTGKVPEATVKALWDDGTALWELSAGVRQLSKDPSGRALTRPWLDRAVQLGVSEARFARALQRIEEHDPDGASADLLAYVSAGPRPPRLDEARALRSMLVSTERKPSPELLARIRLIEDRPADAVALLGGACQAGMSIERLIALGLAHEHAGAADHALNCYTTALLPSEQTDHHGTLHAAALRRLALAAARAPVPVLTTIPRELLNRAARDGHGAAHWALARLGQTQNDPEGTLRETENALKTAEPDSAWAAEARALQLRLHDGRARAAAAERRRAETRRAALLAICGATAGLGAVTAVLLLFHGLSLARALRRRPAFFTEVARAVAEVRHDVLKHRASVLGLASEPGAAREEVRRALLEPEPLSHLVTAIYDRLRAAARGHGLTLRRLGREPIMGALVRDLRRAEALISGNGDAGTLAGLDGRLREYHAEQLASLLKLGPRTALNAARISAWIQGVEAERRSRGAGWTRPSLMMTELTLEFPVEREALAAVFANLLRNAQAAVGESGGHVAVRLESERDATGRQIAALAVGDSGPETLSLETIESRESGRGLAIVRDAVRQWRGSIVIRPEPAPFTKSISVRFPL